jgi:tRNA threonylcarbamoyladenosine biosynthesis protein TsaE
MMHELYTSTPEETQAWGARLGALLFPGAVIGLEGDLGAGKTCFVKGLATGLGLDEDEISSPTFTLIAEHYRGRLPLYHIDLYRLEGANLEEVGEVGIEEYLAGQGVAAIEWFRFLAVGVANEYLLVTLIFVNENERVLRLAPHGEQYERIMKNLLSAESAKRAM